jgi:hypothetical protein
MPSQRKNEIPIAVPGPVARPQAKNNNNEPTTNPIVVASNLTRDTRLASAP